MPNGRILHGTSNSNYVLAVVNQYNLLKIEIKENGLELISQWSSNYEISCLMADENLVTFGLWTEI